MMNWLAGMRIDADRLLLTSGQQGVALVSFEARTSWTQAVVFPTPFPSAPSGVMTQIQSGAGPTARWGSRAISITPSGFTLFCFVMDAASASATWSSVPVYWDAQF